MLSRYTNTYWRNPRIPPSFEGQWPEPTFHAQKQVEMCEHCSGCHSSSAHCVRPSDLLPPSQGQLKAVQTELLKFAESTVAGKPETKGKARGGSQRLVLKDRGSNQWAAVRWHGMNQQREC